MSYSKCRTEEKFVWELQRALWSTADWSGRLWGAQKAHHKLGFRSILQYRSVGLCWRRQRADVTLAAAGTVTISWTSKHMVGIVFMMVFYHWSNPELANVGKSLDVGLVRVSVLYRLRTYYPQVDNLLMFTKTNSSYWGVAVGPPGLHDASMPVKQYIVVSTA